VAFRHRFVNGQSDAIPVRFISYDDTFPALDQVDAVREKISAEFGGFGKG
jgi:hypothetical protein